MLLVLRPSLVLAALVVAAAAGAAGSAAERSGPAAPRETSPFFFVSKSENRNQVHYVVKVDETCAPVGNAPVRGFWRDYERGKTATSPLLDHEQRAYGIARQRVVVRGPSGGEISMALRALPGRELTVRVRKEPAGACTALAYTEIAGEPARLYFVHVVLRTLGVGSIVLSGWATEGGRPVREVIRP